MPWRVSCSSTAAKLLKQNVSFKKIEDLRFGVAFFAPATPLRLTGSLTALTVSSSLARLSELVGHARSQTESRTEGPVGLTSPGKSELATLGLEVASEKRSYQF